MKTTNTYNKAPRTSVVTTRWRWNHFIMRLKNSWVRRMYSTLSTVEELHSTSSQSYLNAGDHEPQLFIGSTLHHPTNSMIPVKKQKKTILKNYTRLLSKNSMDSTGTTRCSSKHSLMKDIQYLAYLEQQEFQEHQSALPLTESANTYKQN